MMHSTHARRAVLALLVTFTAISLCACGTARVRVQPAPVPARRPTTIAPIAVSLSIDEYVATYQTTARTSVVLPAGPGYGTIEVAFDLGGALNGTVEQIVRAHFREVTASPDCSPGSRMLLRVEFAKPPEIRIRWRQGMVSEGGGATVDLALSVSARRCGGSATWHSIATGFGTGERIESSLFGTTPWFGQFQPAVDMALADLADHLDAIMSTAARQELAAPSLD